jgi:hypothetical protein
MKPFTWYVAKAARELGMRRLALRIGKRLNFWR